MVLSDSEVTAAPESGTICQFTQSDHFQWEKFVKDISHDPRIERKREREPEVDFGNIKKRYKTQKQSGQLQKYEPDTSKPCRK